MSDSAQNVCLPLPNTITNTLTTYKSREQFLVKHLERVLPTTDSKDVLEELKRSFILDKHKLWKHKKKANDSNRKEYSKRKFFGHKILGTKHGLVYEKLLPLNQMWTDYIRHNLGTENFNNLPTSPIDANWEVVNQRLLKADYHGAVISVVRSKDPNSVGMRGIIIQETKNCFKIITSKNRLRTLPKNSSLFRFHMPNAHLEVYGKEICYKPAERSVKKFKAFHLGIL